MNDWLRKTKETLRFLFRVPDTKSSKQKLAEDYDILHQLSMLFSDLDTEDRGYSMEEMIESIKSPELMLHPESYINYAADRGWLTESEEGWRTTVEGTEVIQNFLLEAGLSEV